VRKPAAAKHIVDSSDWLEFTADGPLADRYEEYLERTDQMLIPSIVVYEEGDVIHMAVLPIGSEHITNDIALGLRTSIEVAEKLKIDYGSCVIDARNKKEILDLVDVGAAQSEIVSRHYLSEIINARVGEILEKINKELHKIKRSGLLPSGIVFTGGGAKIRGLVELAKEDLRLPASLGYPLDIESVSEKSSDISFATAIGLCAWGAAASSKSKASKPKIISSAGGKVAGHLQKIFKMLIP
jgi:cell division protein FtsA